MSSLKYLYLTSHVHKELLEEKPQRSGLYQWLIVFGGDVKQHWKDIVDLESYDGALLNICSGDE